MRLSRLACLLPVALVVVAVSAAAQQRAVVDANVAAAVASGVAPPTWNPRARVTPGRAAVVIELRPGATVDAIVALANHDVTVERIAGRPLAWQRFVSVTVGRRGLAALARSASVARVRLATQAGMPPLDRSAQRLGLEAARGAGRATPLTGEGVVIADLDTLVDVFHPAFFRADAGYYDWIDENRDGHFTPGRDAIDLDGNGVGDPSEIAVLLPAAPMSFYGVSTSSLRHGAFDPSIDWVFLDTLRNGVRDFSVSAGFDDTTPAFGEPLFVPDDVNGDGMIGPEERFARLGTSKIRAVLVEIETPYPTRFERTRGVDLSTLAGDYTGGIYGYSDSLHGTGVDGILVGDVPFLHRRWVGIAPDAELLVAFETQHTTDSLMWALTRHPDVVLHEYVTWTRAVLDGSDPVSSMIDASTASDGVTHVCPSGNIGGSRKHGTFVVPAGATFDAIVDAPDRYPELEITIHHRSTSTLGLSLVEPDGFTVHGLVGTPLPLTTGGTLYAMDETTTRGWRVASFAASNYDPMDPSLTVSSGHWTVRIVGDPTMATTVEGYVSDSTSGFGVGAVWTLPTTDASTMAFPSTADACLAVGAFPSHTDADGPWYSGGSDGVIRDFSGRGPRIDHARTIDISAPDDPWAPLGVGEVYPTSPGYLVAPAGAYQVFGGTSGAGPHAAGVAALLVQHGLRAPAVRTAIDTGALHDVATGPVPNDDHGHGRLSAAGALGVSLSGTPPTVTLITDPAAALPGTTVHLVPTVDDADGVAGLTLQWDVGYDGVWDGPADVVAPRELTSDHVERIHVKVRATDDTGRAAEAAVLVVFTDRLPVDAGVDSGRTDAGVGRASSGGNCAVGGGARAPPAAPGAILAMAWLGRRRARR